jgi:Mg/Co/Ni transporter MgtE
LLYRGDLERSTGSQPPGYGTLKEIEEKPVEHGFSKDFLTGCLALIVIGLILFILIPLLIFVLKLSVLVAIPIGLVAAFVIFTAFFGRIINILRRKW